MQQATQQNKLIQQLAQEGVKPPILNPVIIFFIWMGILIIGAIITVTYLGLRDDWLDKLSEGMFIAELALILIVSASAAIASSNLALPDSNQIPWIRFVPLVPAALLVGLLYIAWNTTQSMSLAQGLALKEIDCIIRFMVAGIPPALLIFISLRKRPSGHILWTASLASLSIMSFVYLQLRLVHPMDDPMALMIWHLLPALVLILVGVFVGRFFVGRI